MHCACPQEGAALQCKPQVQLAKQLYVRFVFTHQPTALPHAQDFVKLAKWEDRGYYALRTSAEKAQRQLHKLQRRAASALGQPSAGVLAAASRAMGLADLAAPELPAELPAAGKQPKKKRRAAAMASEPDWAAQARASCFQWSGAQAVILGSFLGMVLVLCIHLQACCANYVDGAAPCASHARQWFGFCHRQRSPHARCLWQCWCCSGYIALWGVLCS